IVTLSFVVAARLEDAIHAVDGDVAPQLQALRAGEAVRSGTTLVEDPIADLLDGGPSGFWLGIAVPIVAPGAGHDEAGGDGQRQASNGTWCKGCHWQAVGFPPAMHGNCQTTQRRSRVGRAKEFARLRAPRAARCPRARLERQTVCGADRLSAENETIQSTDPRAKKLRVSRGIGALSQSGAPIPRGARLA